MSILSIELQNNIYGMISFFDYCFSLHCLIGKSSTLCDEERHKHGSSWEEGIYRKGRNWIWERKRKHWEKRWMDFRKYDSTEILFFHNWKIQTKSEKNIQKLGKTLNSYHKIAETLEKKTKFKEPSQSSSNTKDHEEG